MASRNWLALRKGPCRLECAPEAVATLRRLFPSPRQSATNSDSARVQSPSVSVSTNKTAQAGPSDEGTGVAAIERLPAKVETRNMRATRAGSRVASESVENVSGVTSAGSGLTGSRTGCPERPGMMPKTVRSPAAKHEASARDSILRIVWNWENANSTTWTVGVNRGIFLENVECRGGLSNAFRGVATLWCLEFLIKLACLTYIPNSLANTSKLGSFESQEGISGRRGPIIAGSEFIRRTAAKRWWTVMEARSDQFIAPVPLACRAYARDGVTAKGRHRHIEELAYKARYHHQPFTGL